jgi:hypothetical protein
MTPHRNKIIGVITSAVVALTLLGGATGASAAPKEPKKEATTEKAPKKGATTETSKEYFKPRSR